MRRGTRGRGYGGRPPVPQQSHNQNNIPRLLQPQPVPHPFAGPLATDHLQGLKDIDMELELLKRKREIIEQQQQILSNSYRQRNDYEQPMYNAGRESRYEDYTRLYSDNRGSDSRGQAGRKRAIPVWESETPAKRPAARPSPPRFRREPEPRHRAPAPFRRPPPPKRKETAPGGVSKARPSPPLKLATYRPAERKKLVAEASSLVLRADREPTHQMLGRLELALGAIIKEMRERADSDSLFKHPTALRAMKQAVRERLRTALVGHSVSSADVIKLTYYQQYPPATDGDVIMKGRLTAENKNFANVDAANPEAFFKRNIRNLMSLKMEEMIRKLQQTYRVGVPSNVQNRHKTLQKNKPKHKDETKAEPEGEAKTDNKPETEETKDNQGNDDPQIVETDKDDDKDLSESKVTTESCDNIDLTNDDGKETKQSEISVKSDSKDAKASEVKVPEFVVPKELINNEQYIALDKLLTNKMLHLLKKYTPEFIKIMDIDAMYRKTKASIIAETARRLTNKGPAAGQDQTNTSANQKPAGDRTRPQLLYVKILGKPSLPKRKAMETFFSQFQPKSIKKHRTVHNLLFVGFVDKQSYDDILAADGTTIGRFTLDIKVSERNDNKIKPNDTNNSLPSEADKLNESTDSVFGSEIDEQITDLLTSIRKSEDVNFSDDISMEEPSSENKALNGDQTDKTPVDLDDKQNDNTASQDEVELKDVIQNNDDNTQEDDEVVEVNDALQNETNDDDVVEVNEADIQNDADDVVPENDEINQGNDDVEDDGDSENKDAVGALKAETKDVKTPTRSSARLATPGGIKTRRMSKLPE